MVARIWRRQVKLYLCSVCGSDVSHFGSFKDELFEERHVLHVLLSAIHFNVLDLHQYVFLVNSVQSFPNQDPQVRVFRSRANAPHFSSPQPVSNSLAIKVNHLRTDSFS